MTAKQAGGPSFINTFATIQISIFIKHLVNLKCREVNLKQLKNNFLIILLIILWLSKRRRRRKEQNVKIAPDNFSEFLLIFFVERVDVFN